MKNLIFALCLIFGLSIAYNSNAQMSKKEKKEWKKKLKKTPVEEFKAMIEENKSMKGKVGSLEGQVSSLQSRIADKDSEVSRMKEDLEAARAEAASSVTVESGNETRTAHGVVFKVQIGAYKEKDMSKYADNDGGFGLEESGDVQKYTIGHFRDYWEADTFKKYIRKMGVKDAWIVPYKDGVRVPIKDVLEGIIN